MTKIKDKEVTIACAMLVIYLIEQKADSANFSFTSKFEEWEINISKKGGEKL